MLGLILRQAQYDKAFGGFRIIRLSGSIVG